VLQELSIELRNGDIIIDENDVFGEEVNIAAQLEPTHECPI
jgi:hypothetical protein